MRRIAQANTCKSQIRMEFAVPNLTEFICKRRCNIQKGLHFCLWIKINNSMEEVVFWGNNKDRNEIKVDRIKIKGVCKIFSTLF